MSPHEILIAIMAAFAVLGALDRIFGNRVGLGPEFENGILSLGSLALSMVGIISLAPVLAGLLRPVVVPVYRVLGADPAMFAGTILANDMGGAPLAKELAGSPEAAKLGGLLVGAMLGATGVFTIPVGVLVGGLVAGFPILMVLRNLIPIVLIALLIALGLWKWEGGMIRGFAVFGKIIVAIITIGLAAALVESLTGLVLIPGMAPISEGLSIVGDIALVLAGAFPLVWAITKVFRKPLMKLGSLLGMNDTAAAGLIASLANSIAMFGMVKDMDQRGKVINVAFAVSAAFVFGDHLGFTAGFDPEMLVPVILGKLVGGVTAIFVAMAITGGKHHDKSRA